MKLTDAQTMILRRLSIGYVMEYVGPPLDRFVWAGGYIPSPRKKSMEILENLGLVEIKSCAWWGRSYVITDEGREYLSES